MTKYYLLVLDYKPSFDSAKGDKHKMEFHYTRQMETPGGRGGRGGRRGQGAAAPPPQHKMMKRTVKVWICETTNVDKTLHIVISSRGSASSWKYLGVKCTTIYQLFRQNPPVVFGKKFVRSIYRKTEWNTPTQKQV